MSNAKGEKVESCSRIKEGNRKLAQGEDEVQKIWKEYFEICITLILSNRLQSTYVALMGFREVSISKESQLEELRLKLRVSIKNERAVGKDKIKGEMIKGGGVTGWWTGFGGYVIRPLKMVLCLKIGDLL